MDFLADVNIEVSMDDNYLKERTFLFLVKLMGFRDQLRMNHWQTEKYAEHVLTDDVMAAWGESIDAIAEAALGSMGRPQINSIENKVSDIVAAPTKSVIDLVDAETQNLIGEYKDTKYERILALLGELDANNKKFKFLCTLA